MLCLVTQSCLTLFDPMECSPPDSSVHGIFQYWSGLPCPPPRDLPNRGIEPRFLTLQADSLPSEPPGKPKNTGVGSLSLLQGLFPTQELEPGSPALQVDSLPAELPVGIIVWSCSAEKNPIMHTQQTRFTLFYSAWATIQYTID